MAEVEDAHIPQVSPPIAAPAALSNRRPIIGAGIIGATLALLGASGYVQYVQSRPEPVVVEKVVEVEVEKLVEVEVEKQVIVEVPVERPGRDMEKKKPTKKVTPYKQPTQPSPIRILPREWPMRVCDEAGWCWTYL